MSAPPSSRKSRVITPMEKRIIAYHEGGHAVVGHFLPKADPVFKVTIVARGMAGGYTRSLPADDRRLQDRSYYEAMMAQALGGHVAEELIFGEPTTGAHDDIGKVTHIAREMVTRPDSSGWRITSSTWRLYSGSSSRKSTPRCASEISPGRGGEPPPTSAIAEAL